MARRGTAKKDEEIDDLLDGPKPGEGDDDDDGDGDDDDDGEDDDDPDSGEGEPLPNAASMPVTSRPPAPRGPAAEIITTSPRPARPRGPRGPRGLSQEQREASGALRQARTFSESAHKEIDELLAGLNFQQRRYEVRLTRLEPDVDENDVPCVGMLHTYRQNVSVDQIQNRFGGGTYEIKVWGPHPTTGAKAIIKTEVFTIAGFPKPMKTQKEEETHRDGGGTNAELIRVMSESNERMQERLASVFEKQASSPNVATEVATAVTATLAPILKQLVDKSEETKRLELEARREERDREKEERADRRAEEDRKRQEDRDRREEDRRREDKARDDERERRKEEAKKEEDRRQEERDRKEEERRKEDKKLADEREERKEEREEARRKEDQRLAEVQRQHDKEMQLAADRAKADADRQKEHLQLITNFSERQIDMLQNRQEKGGVSNMIDQLRLLNELRGDLRGDNNEPSGMQKFTEGLQDVVGVVMPAAQQAIQAFRGGKPAPQQQATTTVTATAGPTPKPMVVDLGPVRPALQQNPGTGPTAPVPTAAPATAGPMPQAPAEPASPTEIADVPNDLTSFVFPDENTEMVYEAGTMLVKNVDLAIQRNMTIEQIVDEVLDPFETKAPFLMGIAQNKTAEEIVGFLTSNVPASWAIMTPRGEEVVKEAFEAWAQDDD